MTAEQTRPRARFGVESILVAGVVGVLVALGAAACDGGDGGDDGNAADPSPSRPTPTSGAPAPSRDPLPSDADFGEVAFRIDGGALRCALLAETTAQHMRGLMGRTDLGGYAGMLFRFRSDTSGGFYMRNTPLPLSIAWFDADGRLVSTADMDPCLDQAECPTYRPAGPYRYALEVPQGDLGPLGVRPGSRLEVGGACP